MPQPRKKTETSPIVEVHSTGGEAVPLILPLTRKPGWEYHVEVVRLDQAQARLNALGRQGWELASLSEAERVYGDAGGERAPFRAARVVMKRPALD